ncbi:serine threonine-protein kinase brsk1 isoform x2 [Stylonychia lemnae]|uniref:Serine threonine-protein kinase brsk1 isoform x2 n=1 Tax=Stylonychia lemnae TaxID=5949 RepID=A0A078AHK8_STYLE|nr:serine threonine-protein kinase brsk1 isoform x2 [Stylonychia lemnae]|eukprot:CDW81729.1 serine threonine-protein kinase brsk1 isoform x2 [Stylonychia lemnae]
MENHSQIVSQIKNSFHLGKYTDYTELLTSSAPSDVKLEKMEDGSVGFECLFHLEQKPENNSALSKTTSISFYSINAYINNYSEMYSDDYSAHQCLLIIERDQKGKLIKSKFISKDSKSMAQTDQIVTNSSIYLTCQSQNSIVHYCCFWGLSDILYTLIKTIPNLKLFHKNKYNKNPYEIAYLRSDENLLRIQQTPYYGKFKTCFQILQDKMPPQTIPDWIYSDFNISIDKIGQSNPFQINYYMERRDIRILDFKRMKIQKGSILEIHDTEIVYLGIYNKSNVIIREIFGEYCNLRMQKSVERQLKLLALIQHENYLNLIGVTLDESTSKLYFIHENFSMNTLHKILQKEKYFILRQIAAYFLYIHLYFPDSYLHLNLTPHSILIDEKDLSVKVKELGTRPNIANDPQFISNSTYGSTFPPEIINQNQNLSVFSDTYMLGQIAYIIFAMGKLDESDQQELLIQGLSSKDLILQQIKDKKAILEKIKDMPEDIKEIIQGTILFDERKRLHIIEIVGILKAF